MRDTALTAIEYYALSAQREREGSGFADYWHALGKMWEQIDVLLQVNKS
jgi:hypothetical protein